MISVGGVPTLCLVLSRASQTLYLEAILPLDAALGLIGRYESSAMHNRMFNNGCERLHRRAPVMRSFTPLGSCHISFGIKQKLNASKDCLMSSLDKRSTQDEKTLITFCLTKGTPSAAPIGYIAKKEKQA